MDFLKLQQEIMKDAMNGNNFKHRLGARTRYGETWLIYNQALFAIVPDERVYLDKVACFDNKPLTEEACTAMSKGAAFKDELIDTGTIYHEPKGLSYRILINPLTGEEILISEKYYKFFKANKADFVLMGTDGKNMVYFFHEGHLVGGILPIIVKKESAVQNDE